MPFYPYRCKKCEREFSLWHAMNEKKTDCPFCEHENVLVRTLATFNTLKPVDELNKIGDVVKRSIDEYKEQNREMREELKEKSNDFTN